MNLFDATPKICSLRAEEERILASFTRRLIEISAATSVRGAGTPPTAALNMMRVPSMMLDEEGFVADANAAAEALFDEDINIKDGRIYLRDARSRTLLKEAIDGLRASPRPNTLIADPIIVQRKDKLPVILRIWPCHGEEREGAQATRFVLTLNALGPRPGPPPQVLAKTFGLTPSEARLACIIARGAPPNIAAQELKISKETARNQLKSIFAKTDTHRQSELVALLLQVE
jgi:DNA-binding CsgD family transcriptional regulator